jgi:hypothetical protein
MSRHRSLLAVIPPDPGWEHDHEAFVPTYGRAWVSTWASRARRGGEMPEMPPFYDADRKNTWRFRRYSDSFAMDF